jgi:hypothetical protein
MLAWSVRGVRDLRHEAHGAGACRGCLCQSNVQTMWPALV